MPLWRESLVLESLHLRGAPAFDPSLGVTIGPLTPVNFFFGPNGSGKTTISRALEDPNRFPGTALVWASSKGALGIKVYNSDYVAETLKQAANLPGVFLLGKKNAEIQSEIEELAGPSGSIAALNKRLGFLRESLDEKLAEIRSTRDELKEAAWVKRSAVPVELQEMFRGVNAAKDKLLLRLLDAAAAHPATPDDFDTLASEAAAVLADDAVELTELPLGRYIRLEDAPGFELLAIPVVGSGDVRLAALVEQLGNADWVQQGRHYLDQTGRLCPFCQQQAPEDLVEQIDAYFDKRYTQQIEQLKELQEYVQSWVEAWRIYFGEIFSQAGATDHLDAVKFQAARLQLEQASGKLTSTITAKLDRPSTIFSVEDPTAQVEAVNALVVEANASMRTFNRRLKNRASAKKALLDRCWASFARQTLATEVGHFEGALPALDKGKASLETTIETHALELKAKEVRLRELQAQTTSSKPIIATINRLLDSVGFHSFRLKESTVMPDGYSLLRENGEIAADTLSEGERTFITFLYFTQSLQGTPQERGELNDLVAVIDDPISSLDSDVLYAVSTIVRRIVADIAAGAG